MIDIKLLLLTALLLMGTVTFRSKKVQILALILRQFSLPDSSFSDKIVLYFNPPSVLRPTVLGINKCLS